ncbi:MAG: NTP transferase domain-containing protein [Nitrososphaeraceae archaeon]
MMAAIMCGGKGSRMREFASIEKPLLKLKGQTMVELVLNTLVKSEKFRRIVVATSYNALLTAAYIDANLSHEVDIIKTEGRSYSHDISMVLNILKPATVFVVPADLPLLELKNVRETVSQWRQEDTCISVLSAKQYVIGMGIKPSVIVRINSRQYCHTGISVIDSTKVYGTARIAERYIILNEKGVAVNVNTRSDFEAAERMMCRT